MHLNLSLTPSQIPVARKPELGVESKVYFAPERGVLLGTVLATAAALAEYPRPVGSASRPVAATFASASIPPTASARALPSRRSKPPPPRAPSPPPAMPPSP